MSGLENNLLPKLQLSSAWQGTGGLWKPAPCTSQSPGPPHKRRLELEAWPSWRAPQESCSALNLALE